MKLLNTYYNYEPEDKWSIEIPNLTSKANLITFNNYYHTFHVYYFKPENVMKWCGDKLTRKDNEIISNLQK